jgi:hypothetical protein
LNTDLFSDIHKSNGLIKRLFKKLIESVLIRRKDCWLQVDGVLVSSEGGRESVCRVGTLIYGEFLCDEI